MDIPIHVITRTRSKSFTSRHDKIFNEFLLINEKPNEAAWIIKTRNITQEIKHKMEELIGTIHHAPSYLQLNNYIHSGYRIGFNSTCKILRSLFMLHNESVNVWSHLFGVFLFLCFIIYTAIKLGPKIDSDIHIKIMDEFNRLIHNDDMTECDPLLFKNVTEQLHFIYHQDVNLNENKCISSFTDFSSLQCSVNDIYFEQINKGGFNESYSEQNFSDSNEKLEYILSKAETYIYGLVNGFKKISNRIRCPEQINNLIMKAKNMTSSLKDRIKDYFQELDYSKVDLDHISRMVNLDNMTTKVSDTFHKFIESQKDSEYPDITFSSFFESSGDILHDVTKVPLYIHMFSAIMCLLCSAVYHLFYVHSNSVYKILARLDYAGISFLIGGSGVPPIYYSLYCSDGDILRPLYLLITFSACAFVFFIAMNPRFENPKYNSLLATLFVILGVSSAYPIAQFVLFRNYETMPPFPTIYWVLGGAI